THTHTHTHTHTYSPHGSHLHPKEKSNPPSPSSPDQWRRRTRVIDASLRQSRRSGRGATSAGPASLSVARRTRQKKKVRRNRKYGSIRCGTTTTASRTPGSCSDVVNRTKPDSQHTRHAGVERRREEMDTAGNQSDGLVYCEDRLLPTSDSHMEYDDLPALQEVACPTAPPVYQVEVSVSHLEREGVPESGRSHAAGPGPDTHWLLTQLAHIATGPQSPLLHSALPLSPSGPVPRHVFGTSSGLHSYARPPPPSPSSSAPSHATRSSSSSSSSRSRHPAPPTDRGRGRRRTQKSSESTRSSLSDDEDMGWSHSWPPTAWHCFLKGTRVRFHAGPSVEWQDVEDLVANEGEEPANEGKAGSLKVYGSDGLCLTEHSEVVSTDQSVLQLTFDPGAFGHTPLTAQCPLDHPFYVKHKGWSSFYPSLTVVHYGIPCYEVERGDVYDFTPLDSSAVYVLSSMARRRRTGGAVSPDRDEQQQQQQGTRGRIHHQTPIKSLQSSQPGSGSGSSDATRCKRPMNAFMLFAKKFRVEYTQMHPGRDNRAISVLLGERWKRLRGDERLSYVIRVEA
ncbi:hypothetical protein CRUP_037154, partial [Coryphaenoides rupestris]